jgi:zinc/manganese transport system substrate-binding protein
MAKIPNSKGTDMRWILLFLSFFAMASARAELNVVASLPDFGAIAEVIGGKAVKVTTIARGSEDPHFVDARPSFVRVLNKADLLIEGGAELEMGWLPTLVNAARNQKIQGTGPGHLVLSRYIKLLDVPAGAVDRSMGDVHAAGNPHYWLDPRNGIVIAGQIADAFAQLDAKNAAAFKQNLADFSGKLNAKWQEWQKRMEPLRGTKIITYHRSFEYLAGAFGLEVFGQLEPKPGIEPTPSHINQLVQSAKNADVKLVVIEPFRPRREAEKVAEAIGARMVVTADKTGSTPDAKDYISLFDSIVNKLTAEAPAK